MQERKHPPESRENEGEALTLKEEGGCSSLYDVSSVLLRLMQALWGFYQPHLWASLMW